MRPVLTQPHPGQPWTGRRPAGPLVLLLAAALAVGLPATAQAHAELAGADPRIDGVVERSPPAVTLWFSERPEPRFSEIQVLDPSARRVDRQDLRPDSADPLALRVTVGDLAPGSYTVVWKALSAVDGHVTRGTFAFTVGLGQASTGATLAQESTSIAARPDQVLSRLLLALGLAGAVGAFPFIGLALRPALAAARAAPAISGLLIGQVGLVALVGFGLALLGQTGALVSQAASTYDVPFLAAVGPPALDLVLGARYGSLWLAKMGLLVVLGACAWRLRRGQASPLLLGLGASAGAALLLGHALTAHAAAAPGAGAVALASEWLHLLALVTWVGGLGSLLATLRPVAGTGPPQALVGRQEPPRADPGEPIRPAALAAVAAHLAPRFSTLAAACVAVLIGTGVYQAWLLVGGFGPLGQTSYGQTLLLKGGFVLLLLALAAVNLVYLRPRLERAQARPEASSGPLRWLRVTVSGELALAGGVLLASAALANLQPAREAAIVQGVSAQARADDVRATLRVQPGAAGPNRFQLTLTDRQGAPLPGVERVALRFTMQALDLGESEVVATPRGEGQFLAQSGALGVPGPWRVEAVVRRPGRDDARPTFDLTIGQPLPPGPLAFAASAAEGNLVLGLELAVLGVGLAAWALWRRRPGRLLWPASVGVLVAGALVSATSAAALSTEVRNPVPPTQASLTRGEAIYGQRCALCHGESGRGDGPLAVGLNPRPADLRVHLAAGHTDAQLFDWVTNGYPGTAMPAFKNELSEEDRWHTLNYIRAAFGPGGPAAR